VEELGTQGSSLLIPLLLRAFNLQILIQGNYQVGQTGFFGFLLPSYLPWVVNHKVFDYTIGKSLGKQFLGLQIFSM